jgi:hypothetical protein
VNADIVTGILEGIGKCLGRMSIVILDQFDDYQLAAREQFIGRRKDWIKPRELTQRNRTWALIHDLLREETARLLVVTRSDASAGLHSIRLTDKADSFTVSRLKVEWLVQWFEQATADDGKGEVIANADAGWHDLKKQLERDLTPHGRLSACGSYLGWLTAKRRSGHGSRMRGMGSQSSLSFAVRSHTSRLLKTKVLALAELASIVGDSHKLQKALDRLKRDEVVREKSVPGDRGSRWQLDHDYIARTVVAEERAANILSLQLRDAYDAWGMAGTNIRQRYRNLLPLKMQAKLALARVQSRRGFTYRPYRVYAGLSTLRALPFVLLLVGVGWLWHQEALRGAATQIVDGLHEQSYKGGRAAVALWGASPGLRIRVVDELLDRPDRLRDAGTDWVRAFISVELAAARDLKSRLISRLDRKDLDPAAQQSLIKALGSVAERLDARDVAETTKDLVSQLDRKDLDPLTRISLFEAIGSVADRLDARDAAETRGTWFLGWTARTSIPKCRYTCRMR